MNVREMRGRFNRAEIKDKVAKAVHLLPLDGSRGPPAPFLSGASSSA